MTERAPRARWLISGLSLPFMLAGCGSDNTLKGFENGMGGVLKSVGGSLARGGSQSAGGSTAAGNGGNPSAGGAVTAGGAVAESGGSSATASGAAPGAGGGKASAGGATPIGGAANSNVGGNAATGGATPSVGGKAAGGGAATGGAVTATGGSSSIPGSGVPETKPMGYGQATTGGSNVTAVSVSSFAAVQAAVDAYSGTGGLVLNYTGKFDYASITDPCTQWTASAETLEIKNKSNITLLGADGSSAHFGIHIASAASNIIVRNMTIGLTAGGDASDMISIEGMSGSFPTNIWIDHNTLFSSMVECANAGDVEFDGMIDVKKGADKVTVSYNHMHDHHKVSLNGFSDSDSAIRHITFHHNLFENVGSRTPLQRGGLSHMLNNYFYKVTVSGINVRVNGNSLVEANYFESVANPVTSRDSDVIGYWELRSNNLATQADVAAGNAFGITWTSGDTGTVNATNWATTKVYPESLGYTYTAHPFQCVKDGLRAVAGAGKGLATLKCN